jgi:hypothetical protein
MSANGDEDKPSPMSVHPKVLKAMLPVKRRRCPFVPRIESDAGLPAAEQLLTVCQLSAPA